MTVWYWCSLPYATFGVGFRDGVVAETAGINRWMLGKDAVTVERWLTKKHARIVVLGDLSRRLT